MADNGAQKKQSGINWAFWRKRPAEQGTEEPAPDRSSMRHLWGREFSVSNPGLDERQVVPFVNDLLKKYLALRQEQQAAPKTHQLARQIVDEAQAEANALKARARREAEVEAARIVANAKQQANDIVAESRRQAAGITEKEVHDTLRAAEAKAALIERHAQQRAQQFFFEVREDVQRHVTSEISGAYYQLMGKLEDLMSNAHEIEQAWRSKTFNILEAAPLKLEDLESGFVEALLESPDRAGASAGPAAGAVPEGGRPDDAMSAAGAAWENESARSAASGPDLPHQGPGDWEEDSARHPAPPHDDAGGRESGPAAGPRAGDLVAADDGGWEEDQASRPGAPHDHAAVWEGDEAWPPPASGNPRDQERTSWEGRPGAYLADEDLVPADEGGWEEDARWRHGAPAGAPHGDAAGWEEDARWPHRAPAGGPQDDAGGWESGPAGDLHDDEPVPAHDTGWEGRPSAEAAAPLELRDDDMIPADPEDLEERVSWNRGRPAAGPDEAGDAAIRGLFAESTAGSDPVGGHGTRDSHANGHTEDAGEAGEEHAAGGVINKDRLFTGEVELVIPPPVDVKQVAGFYQNVQKIPGVKVSRTVGSWDEGTTITVALDKPSPLVGMLQELPGVRVNPPRRTKGGRILRGRGPGGVPLAQVEISFSQSGSGRQSGSGSQ